jgi:penicillin-insensitive murein DD-endopeptidase
MGRNGVTGANGDIGGATPHELARFARNVVLHEIPAVRPAPLAIASIVTALTLSPGASSLGVSPAALHVLPLAGSAPRHPTTARVASLGPMALRFGRSIGSPTEGRLVGGMRVEEGPSLRIVPAYAGGDVRWGLEPLVAMIDRAARALRRRFPDAVLSVGHLSRPGGGDIDRHRSHESGRDADIGFFARSASGKQLLASRFVAFRGDGSAVGWPGAVFDDAKNWALAAALVGDPETHVTHLFVASPLRARLLAYAERTGVAAPLRVRAAELMQQPRGVLPHDDHFHVRIGCPGHMSGCVENPAARPAPLPTMAGHGRRGGVPQGWVTTAPKRPPTAPPARPTNPTGGAPADDPTIERRPRLDEAPEEPDSPAPSVHAPVDDVDG